MIMPLLFLDRDERETRERESSEFLKSYTVPSREGLKGGWIQWEIR